LLEQYGDVEKIPSEEWKKILVCFLHFLGNFCCAYKVICSTGTHKF
jgi:hypothetical protein